MTFPYRPMTAGDSHRWQPYAPAGRAYSFFAGVAIVAVAALGAATGGESDVRGQICARGHSATLRLHGAAYYELRNAAFARAGVPVYRQCHVNDMRADCLVVDHIWPLELCLRSDNCNRLDNVQVQTRADAEAKDARENEERARYCRGEETREEALSHFTRTTK